VQSHPHSKSVRRHSPIHFTFECATKEFWESIDISRSYRQEGWLSCWNTKVIRTVLTAPSYSTAMGQWAWYNVKMVWSLIVWEGSPSPAFSVSSREIGWEECLRNDQPVLCRERRKTSTQSINRLRKRVPSWLLQLCTASDSTGFSVHLRWSAYIV